MLEFFATTLALVGAVIVIAALLSGLIERSGLPQVAIFLALGAALGPWGLGWMDVTLDSPILQVVATLSLVLVLFTDAVRLDIREVREHGRLAFLVLGPGTIASAALMALAGWRILGLSLAAAAILGAALASTDPVLLRGLLRRRDLSVAVRQALRMESGMNDAVLLPVVIVAMALLGRAAAAEPGHWVRLGLELFLLGPGAGVAVGLLAVGALDLVRRRIGVRRDYESIYSLGVAFAAYAAAEGVHGSGFLAAFTAGLTISALDLELCDCFLEYGETTAEMALLFTFVLFGSSLIWSGLGMVSGATVLFALVVLLVRPFALALSLWRTRLDRRSRWLIAWFGPRGLSSLLLILLPVFAGLAGSQTLFQVCCLVVLISIVLHGGSLMLLGRGAEHAPVSAPVEAPGAATASSGVAPAVAATGPAADALGSTVAVADGERITVDEMRRLQAAGKPLIVLDARTERAYESSDRLAASAIRLDPDRAVRRATELGLPKQAWLVAFCLWHNEATSARVAHELRQKGWLRARALRGGWNAWETAGLPVEPKPA